MVIDKELFLTVRCIKDGKLYAIPKIENFKQCEDYNIIKCFPIDDIGEIIQKEILIYRKDLMVVK